MPGGLNLVTGAAGFCGRHVVRALLARGERVVATDVASELPVADPALVYRRADLRDPASLPPLFDGVTRVFHTASLYDYSASLERLLQINVDGTRNLISAARGARLDRFVHWSTCGVFGKPHPRANIPFDEDSPSPKQCPGDRPTGTTLVNDYSLAKWRQEQLVWRAHREHGLPVTVVRPAPVYGPGSAYGHGGIILAIAHGLVPAIPRDARNYITASVHVEDVAGFALYVADRASALGEDYNIVDNSVVSYHEFVHYIALLVGRRMRDLPLVDLRATRHVMVPAARAAVWLERRFGVRRPRMLEPQSATYMSSSYWLSNRKSLATGYAYRYPDVREGLQDTIAWMRRAGWLIDRRKVLA
jgi:nucleoside-diphosphate-sugar epimerase